jgi:hypothetical protein
MGEGVDASNLTIEICLGEDFDDHLITFVEAFY